MKYLLIVLFSSLFLAACSGSKQVSQSMDVRYDPCTQQTNLTANDVFTGETVNNVKIDQQNGIVFLTMDVRTYCNADLNTDITNNNNQITLMVSNKSASTDQCVCIRKASTSFKDLTSGTYDLRITDKTGHKLLDQETITIP